MEHSEGGVGEHSHREEGVPPMDSRVDSMCCLQQLLKCWVVLRDCLSVYGLEFQGVWEAQKGKGSKRAGVPRTAQCCN